MKHFYWLSAMLFFIQITGFTANAANDLESQLDEEFKWLQEEAMTQKVVTASRTETSLLKVTKSISVINKKEINDARQYFLPEMMDNVPGVYVARSGGHGQLTKMSIRGASGHYTQFQYNGLPLRDAADTQGTLLYFIGDLYSRSNIDRIEILKGTNSTLYGSQAMAGVINIIPEKWNKGLKYEFCNEIGDRKTFMRTDRIAYGTEDYYIDFNLGLVDTDGQKNGGEYGYEYKNQGISANAGFKFTKDISLEFSSLFYDTDSASETVFPGLDANHELTKNQADKDAHRENQIYQLGLMFNHNISSFWNYTIKGAYGETQRHYLWSAISEDRSNYDGETSYVEMQHNFYPTDWMILTVGADYEKSAYNGQEPSDPYQGIYDPVYYDHEWDVWDAFCNLQFSFLDDSLLFNAGGRYNDPEKFDSKAVWEASGAYIFKRFGTKLHAHVGTGYRTPSLYEIYGGYVFMGELITIGNPNLEPEESTSYEIGMEQFLLNNKFHAGITLFKTNFDNLVVYDVFANRYDNANEAETKGMEGFINLMPCKYFKMGAGYAYTDSKYRDNVTDKWLRKEYLPRNDLNITFSLYPVEHLTIFCRINWQDEKIVPLYDPNFTQVQWEEDSVTTLDMAVTYKFSKNLSVWVRAENLLDNDYSKSGYTMPGRWVYGGVGLVF